MTRAQVTLRGGDVDRFEALKQAVEKRRGFEPTDHELLRMLMGQFGDRVTDQRKRVNP